MTPEPIPFFGLAREFEELRAPLLAAAEDVLRSGQLLQGPAVADLERELARRAGRAHAVAVNSCSDALYFALHTLGVGPGDEVLAPDFSFLATASSILRTGATPVFVDVDDAYSLDLELAEGAVTPATKALVWVHLFGRMSECPPVETFAARHGLLLVEDAAQTFGGERDGRPAGSLGSASCYSFDPTKVVGAPGSGGAVLTDDDEVAAGVRRLRLHGKSPEGEFPELGYNCQMSTLVAAMLAVKLEHEEAWLRRRRELAQVYCDALDGLAALPDLGSGREHIVHKFVARTPERDALRVALAERGAGTLVHYSYRLHELPFVRDRPHRVVEGGRAEAAKGEVLSLPIHPYLREEELERIVGAIAAFRERVAAPARRT
jgi:dTDP-4-amino-4,6-dideoxygalactose transaminase